jgi:hypothetical protein
MDDDHHRMPAAVRQTLDRVEDTADFGCVRFQDVNDTNELDENALHCVARWNDLEAVSVLVDAGIDINKRGEFGETPLHATSSPEVAEFLRAKGAVSVGPDFDDPIHTEPRLRHMRRLGEVIAHLDERVALECPREDKT